MDFLIVFGFLLVFIFLMLVYQYHEQAAIFEQSYSRNKTRIDADSIESEQPSIFSSVVSHLKAFLFIYGVALALT
jgi:hypothetical protein